MSADNITAKLINTPPALLWGANEVARYIGRDRRRTYRMLEGGLLPARKLGNVWVADVTKLRAALGVES